MPSEFTEPQSIVFLKPVRDAERRNMKYVLLGVALLMLQVGTAEGGLFGSGNKTRIRGNEATEPELPPFPRGEGGGPSTKIPTCIFSPPAGSEDPIVCIGRVLYPRLKGINKVLRFTTGKPISEWAWISIFRTICCITYMSMAFWGFRTLPMPAMIVVGICTSWIGPVMAFFLIGIWLAPVWFFVKAPILSMNVMCVAYLVASGLGQKALHHLGLDQDGDGDVDMVDIGRAIVKKMPPFFGGGGPPEGGLAPGIEYPDAELDKYAQTLTDKTLIETFKEYKLKHEREGKLWRYLTFLNDGLEDHKQKLLEQINTLRDEVAEMTLNQKIKDTKDNEEIEKYKDVLDEISHKKKIKDAEAKLKQSAAKINKNIKDADAKVKSLELKQSKKEFSDAQKKELDDAKDKLKLFPVPQQKELEDAEIAYKKLLDAKIDSVEWFKKVKNKQPTKSA
jgi:hypothetical protein